MKKIIFAFLLFITLCESVHAENIEFDNGIYVNNFNIIMTEDEVQTLRELGFTDYEIESLEEDEFNNNKDLDATLVATTNKYYKTTMFIPSIMTASLNNNSQYSLTEEISEEEYENSENQVLPLGLTNGYVETTYKKMTTTISYVNSNYYRFKNTLFWKRLPSTRSYDIIGIGIDSTVSGVSNSKQYKTTASIEDSSTGSCYPENYTSASVWELSSTGYAATFLLPSDTSVKRIIALNTYMYFNVQKLTSNTILTLNAYGSYRHAQRSVNSSVGYSISVGTSGINFDVNLSNEVVESYDSMSTAQATYSGLHW